MLGLIGGTGLNQLNGLQLTQRHTMNTRYGSPSAPLQHGLLQHRPVVFLPRHGQGHRVPPHAINYRANVYALKLLGVTHIVGVAAVGGIAKHLDAAEVVLPDDILDYTWGRAHSYSLSDGDELQHVEFSPPYNPSLRLALLSSAKQAGVTLHDGGVHAVTQGPRLETAAEIRKLQRDGADMVGMTGMPEAALAMELGLPYASLAVVVNRAAGLGEGAIHAEIESSIRSGMDKALRVLEGLRYGPL